APAPRHFFARLPRQPHPTLFPYTTLFRSPPPSASSTPTRAGFGRSPTAPSPTSAPRGTPTGSTCTCCRPASSIPCSTRCTWTPRSEEHTSELQSLAYLVCRLLLEKKKIKH